METVRVVRKGYVETKIYNPDVARMLSAKGDYVLVRPVPKSNRAAPMSAMRRQRNAEGWRRLDFFLEPWQAELVDLVREDGETYSSLLTRLLLEHCSCSAKPKVQTDK